jgi:septal ring-binding cell division protein DamX
VHRHLVAGAMLLALSSPALAAEFYVVMEVNPKDPWDKCRVAETKPDGTTMVMVGEGPYATREEAKQAQKKAPECAKPKK